MVGLLCCALALAGCATPEAPPPAALPVNTSTVPAPSVGNRTLPVANMTLQGCSGYGAYMAIPYALGQDAAPEGFEVVPFAAIVGVEAPGDPNAVLFVVASHCSTATVEGVLVPAATNLFYGIVVRPPVQYRFGQEADTAGVLTLGAVLGDAASANLTRSWGIPATQGTVQFTQEQAAPPAAIVHAVSPLLDLNLDVACSPQGESQPAFATRFFAAKEGQLTGAMNITVGAAMTHLGGGSMQASLGAPLGVPGTGGLGVCLRGDPSWDIVVTQTVFSIIGPIEPSA